MTIWISITLAVLGLLWAAQRTFPRWWSGYFSLLSFGAAYFCWIQLQAGCHFTLGKCYSNQLAAEHFFAKSMFLLVSELSLVIAGSKALWLFIQKNSRTPKQNHDPSMRRPR